MACSTLHDFSKLPPEIRLKIWELAIRPSHHRGLHYFSLVSPEDAYVGEDGTRKCNPVVQSPTDQMCLENDKTFDGRRSVYLWDIGLWSACRESREVILQFFHIQDWGKRVQECKNDCHDKCCRVADLLLCVRSQKDKDLQVRVRPYGDVFCLSPKGQGAMLQWWGFYWDWSFVGTCTRDLIKVALEVDSSWNINWPEDPNVLRKECSPRGLFTRLVMHMADSLAERAFCWLIDTNGEPPHPDTIAIDPAVFYDYDREYIALSNATWCIDAALAPEYYHLFSDDTPSEAVKFMRKFRVIYDWGGREYWDYHRSTSGSPHYLDPPFDLEDRIGILTAKASDVAGRGNAGD